MKYLKTLGLAAMAALGLLAFAGSASATTLSTNGAALNVAETFEASIVSGGSTLVKGTSGITLDTCKESVIKATTQPPFTGTSVTAPIPAGNLTFNGCTHKTSVLKPGKLHISWTSGTNGMVSWSGAEVTIESTEFGISCIANTGGGVAIGTYAGVKESNGTLNISGVLPMGACGDANWTGTYTMTTPKLGVEN